MDGWQAAAVIAKAITYGASLAGPGIALFLLLFDADLDAGEQARFRRVALWALALAAITGISRIAIISGMLGGDFGDLVNGTLIGIVLRAGEGRSLVIRLIGIVLVAVALSWPRGRFVGTVSGVAFVCVSFALVGHAEAAGPKPLPGGLLVIHLLGLTFWIGALYPLRQLTTASDLSRVATIAKQFGDMALYVVVTLVLAGGGLLWILIGNPLAILHSEYGRLVLLKLGFVALLLALAAINKLRLVPRLIGGDQDAAASLRRSITAEMAVIGAILLVTAAFTTIVGPPTLG